MEALNANQLGKARRVELDGRRYLAAPVRMIRVGVFPGTSGALFYPASELERSASAWNGVPITVEHPSRADGQLISANSPGVPRIGTVFGANFAGDNLDAEAWFDIDETNRLAPGLVDRISRGYPIEVSTGLRLEQARGTGVFNGKPYAAVARKHRPDHLAVLLSGPGACGVVDGCGLNVNSYEPLASPIPQGIGYAPPATFGPMRMPELFPDTEHAGCRCGG